MKNMENFEQQNSNIIKRYVSGELNFVKKIKDLK